MINPWRWRPRVMKQKHNAKGRAAKSVLRLPDLDIAKSAVLNSLSCPDAQRGYRRAIDEFVEWYCSEPRLSFSKTVILRYRMHLASRNLAPGTVNLRLGAVRRLAYEAADCGLLSADLAAGIRRACPLRKRQCPLPSFPFRRRSRSRSYEGSDNQGRLGGRRILGC